MKNVYVYVELFNLYYFVLENNKYKLVLSIEGHSLPITVISFPDDSINMSHMKTLVRLKMR